MGYRNSALYTLRYVAEMLGEDEEFLRNCSIEMFSEDGCLSAYDDYPASELSEPIVVFTEDGIDNLRFILDERRATGHAPPKPARKSPETTAAAALVVWIRTSGVATSSGTSSDDASRRFHAAIFQTT